MDLQNMFLENFQNLIGHLKKNINDFKNGKLILNDKINGLLIFYENIDSLALNSLLKARKLLDEENKEISAYIKQLNKQKEKIKKFIKQLRKKKNKFAKPKPDEKIDKSINSLKQLINRLDIKFEKLNNHISYKILDIEEENKLVEKIGKLKNKKAKCKQLIEYLKEVQISNLEKSIYFEINEEISEKFNELNEIEEKIRLERKKKHNTHKTMLNLYKNAKQIKNLKQDIALELLDHKFIACQFYSKFLNSYPLINNGLQSKYIKEIEKRKRTQEIKRKNRELKKEKKVEYERLNEFRKEKLEIALEKQRRGEKLHISELKLILDHSHEIKKV
jgi:hypothetical protein